MAGGIQVVRAETRDRVGGALAAHIRCETRPATAVPAVGKRENSILVDDVAGAAAYAASLARTGKRGKPAKPAREFLFAGLPPFGDPHEWPRELADAYFKACLAWVMACAGRHSRIALAVIHRDETAPHLHVLLVPVGERGGEPRLGWTSVRSAFCPGAGRESERLHRMQDHFHAEVASKHGLTRGQPGSQAEHTPIDRAKAAERRAELATRAQGEAEAAAATARAAVEAGSRGLLSRRRGAAGRELIAEREAAEEARAEAERDRALDQARQADEAREAAEQQAAQLRQHVAELDAHVAAIDARVEALDARARDWAEVEGLLSKFREQRKRGAPAPRPPGRGVQPGRRRAPPSDAPIVEPASGWER